MCIFIIFQQTFDLMYQILEKSELDKKKRKPKNKPSAKTPRQEENESKADTENGENEQTR